MIPISPMIRRNFKKLFEQHMLAKFFMTIIQKKIFTANQLFQKSNQKIKRMENIFS